MNVPSPYIIPDESVICYIKDRLTASGLYRPEEVEFIESLVARRDTVPGAEQVKKLFEHVLECEKTAPATEWERYQRQQKASILLWELRVTSYKQRHVLVGVPQRKKHPRFDIPSCTNVRAWQELRISLTTCYGLGFAEARQHLAQQAVADPSVTHLMYLDDDILMPQDAIPKLAFSGHRIIAGMYLKKNDQGESTVTGPALDPQYIYSHQPILPAKEGKPVPTALAGAGMLMIDVNVFKELEAPWFSFIMGPDGRVQVGEDAFFLHKAARAGIPTYCDPSVVGVHVDFRDGLMYGPEWIVDPATKKIRPEVAPQYTSFPPGLDIRELAALDVVDVFGRNKDALSTDGRK